MTKLSTPPVSLDYSVSTTSAQPTASYSVGVQDELTAQDLSPIQDTPTAHNIPSGQNPPAHPAFNQNSTQNQSGDDDLDLLIESIEQVEAMPQVLPEVFLRASDTLNPPVAYSAKKETFDAAVGPDLSQEDGGKGVQYVETEPSPEISPEIEAYLQKVEQSQDQLPQEIVVADGSIDQPVGHARPSKPVVVLPITQEIEEEGQKKSPVFSIRWLVEWSQKIMKMFVGRVIYRQ
ncbi:MAG: hypothetical protein ACOZAN_01595 [Patescibacteria group bacterium]